ncbi:hypothetical protein [Bacillus sp. OK048]|uniref:hypothetical protein n=1 Tax=Bacillus sp. OK048 TaxID=1882761 RepID=UPI000887CED4|nr:hypothetical protein [Bacillus sp. OK048]SDM64667.1 hypothetical protein SAMN05443253_104387 [Bacillus sp. OK048]
MKLNDKRVLGYLTYSVGFILLLVLISNINSHFIKLINETYRIYPWQILIILMYFPIGIYLGIPNILKEFNKTGRWRINFYKIVFVALPMIYISFYWFFPLSYPIPNLLTYTKPAFSFGAMIAGFIIINSITKE